MKRLTIILVVAIIISTIPRICESQVLWDQNDPEVRYSRGVELYDLYDYENAIIEFKEAYKQVGFHKAGDALYNIAVCYRALHMYSESIDAFQEYLEKYGPSLSKIVKKEVKEQIDKMKKYFGWVRINIHEKGKYGSIVDGAKILIDEKEIQQKVYNGDYYSVTYYEVQEGSHKVTIIKEGFKTWEENRTVVSQKWLTIEAHLEKESNPQVSNPLAVAATPKPAQNIEKQKPPTPSPDFVASAAASRPKISAKKALELTLNDKAFKEKLRKKGILSPKFKNEVGAWALSFFLPLPVGLWYLQNVPFSIPLSLIPCLVLEVIGVALLIAQSRMSESTPEEQDKRKDMLTVGAVLLPLGWFFSWVLSLGGSLYHNKKLLNVLAEHLSFQYIVVK